MLRPGAFRTRYVFATFAPVERLALQPYAGSAWRGAFGHALKRTVCIAGMRPCAGCHLVHVCVFPKFFPADQSAASDLPARFASPPVPFVLAPEPTPRKGFFAPDETVEVRMLLLDTVADGAAYALHALIEAARHGIGAARTPLRLVGLGQVGGPLRAPDPTAFAAALAPFPLQPPSAPSYVRIRFVTPLRLRLADDLLTGAQFRPAHLIAAALRRTTLLLGPPAEATAQRIRATAQALHWIAPRFGWLETTRRSTRQAATMRFGGIVGKAGLDLSGAPDMWALLWLASILHLGKGASMGFGRIALDDG
jgi:hypothetical protein